MYISLFINYLIRCGNNFPNSGTIFLIPTEIIKGSLRLPFIIFIMTKASFLKKYVRQGRRCASDLALPTQEHSGLCN